MHLSPSGPNELKDSDYRELASWLLCRRQRHRVSGTSMEPLLVAGDEVMVDQRAYRDNPPQVGELVIARHPAENGLKIIKRVAAVGPDGSFLLQGDNPDPTQSSTSRVTRDQLLGRVTSRFGSGGNLS